MKKILAVLMAVLMLASVAVCGGAVAFADDNVEIHYAYWASMDDYYEQCKADFEASHPGITIVLEHTSWGEYWTKLEAAATGGSVVDVFQFFVDLCFCSVACRVQDDRFLFPVRLVCFNNKAVPLQAVD